MKAIDLRKKSEKELKDLLVDARSSLVRARFVTMDDKDANTTLLPALKKKIARILTIMREKEIFNNGE